MATTKKGFNKEYDLYIRPSRFLYPDLKKNLLKLAMDTPLNQYTTKVLNDHVVDLLGGK